MKFKITLIGEDWGYYIIEDYTDYYDDLKDNEGLSEEELKEFFTSGEFDDKFVCSCNGKHFLYGYLEGLAQSDYCPPVLFERDIIKYVVERVE